MTDEERKARRKEINRQAGNARPAHHPMHRLAHFFKMPTERLRDGLFFCAARRAHQKKLDNLARLQNVRPHTKALGEEAHACGTLRPDRVRRTIRR